MVGWATSMSKSGQNFNADITDSVKPCQFAIDDLTPEHDLIGRFVKHQEGEPMLTSADGTLIPVSVPSNVLIACADVLEDDPSMRLADGIKRKLRVFLDSWRDS